MPDKISFTSARLLSFSRKPTGGVAKFAASWNENVAKAMKWTDIPECMTGASLEGELMAETCELKPTQAEMKKHAIELKINRVADFKTVRLELEKTKGKGHRTELRFDVTFTDMAGAKKLEQYIQTMGDDGKGTLSVSYVVQEELPLQDPDAAQRVLETQVEDIAKSRKTN